MSILRGAGRRRTYLRADARRAQILGIAKDVFAARGYRDANIADICEAAKIGRGTLYQYFDNKRDVLEAVLEDVYQRIEALLGKRRTLAEIPGLEKAPAEMIVGFCTHRIRQMLEAVFQDEAALRLVLREARGLDGAMDKMLAKIDALMLQHIEADTRTAQQAGLVLPHVEPRLVAQFVLGGVEKVVLSALAADEPIDLDAIVRSLVEMHLFGVLTPAVKGEVRR